MRMRGITPGLLTLAILVVSPTSTVCVDVLGSLSASSPVGQSTAGTDKVPRFEWSAFPPEIEPEQVTARFGHLVVPENRSRPDDGKTIRLAVVIIQSTATVSKPDPFLFTTGGPGVLSTVRAARYAHTVRYFTEILKERDVILFEQRGAKYAVPPLLGPEIDEAMAAGIGNLNNVPGREAFVGAVRTLRERLETEGVDLTAYNTWESAADIADLRKVLRIEQWNLSGISYSCRLMLEVLRRYPAGVRTAVLVSPLPPDVSWNEASVENYWTVLRRLLGVCAKDTLAGRVFPDLEQRFLDRMQEAKANPLVISVIHPVTQEPTPVPIDDQGLFACVPALLGNTSYLPYVPAAVHGLSMGDTTTLRRTVQLQMGPSDFAWGMRFSFWCNDEVPFEDPGRFAEHRGFPQELAGISLTVLPDGVSDVWPGREPEPVEKRPVHSPLPVLILSGEFDPDTPVFWGERVAETLPHSFHVVFPGHSHLPVFSHPCAVPLIIEFLNHPDQEPDRTCIEQSPQLEFYVGQ